MAVRARSRRSWGSVRALGSGRFQARYPDADTGRLLPAPGTFATRGDADRWLAARRTDLARRVDLDDRAATRPLCDWWPGYLRTAQSTLKSSTLSNYEQAWRLRVEPGLGSVPVGRLRASHIEDWIADMVAAGVSSSKIIESYGVLKRVLDRAVRDRAISTNPCSLRAGPLPRRPRKDRPVLSPAEVEELATAMRRDDDRVLVRLLAYGGLRIGEALALRRRDVDVAGGRLTVRESVSEIGGRLEVGAIKTYAVRTITLPVSSLRSCSFACATVRPSRRRCCSATAWAAIGATGSFGATPGTPRSEPSTLGASRAGALRCQLLRTTYGRRAHPCWSMRGPRSRTSRRTSATRTSPRR